MHFLRKSASGFKPYKWLNFTNLPASKGYKFELYVRKEEVTTNDLIQVFHKLFEPFIEELEISGGGNWGDFCIDTWNIYNDTYDYSPSGKSQETTDYLQMLEDNGIEPEYSGLCCCYDWERFLPIVLDCILVGRAPYSLDFYCPGYEFMFYFHHTGSLGLYYKKFNDAIMHILKQAMAEDLELRNWTDEKSLALLRG
jgi:hypothetical protein